MRLEIRGVSKTYANGVRALDDVTLTIPAGMYGLLGPNGAGKSTLMRILATLQEPDGGTIHLGHPSTSSGWEIDVVRQKDRVRQTLGYLPQEFGVYPKASAEERLDHFALLKGIGTRRARRAVVEALLRQTNLREVRRQKLGGYSGGMRQRFGVAVALIGDPTLMIVDEPTAGLDPAERVRFLNLLSELGEPSVVPLSTHIVEDVSELCTRMAIIDRGRILLETEPLRAVRDLRGRIWRRAIAKHELAEVEQTHAASSSSAATAWGCTPTRASSPSPRASRAGAPAATRGRSTCPSRWWRTRRRTSGGRAGSRPRRSGGPRSSARAWPGTPRCRSSGTTTAGSSCGGRWRACASPTPSRACAAGSP